MPTSTAFSYPLSQSALINTDLQDNLLNTDRNARPMPWPQIFEVPPEIWTHVAALSGRQSIARLAAVSHAFYSVFAAILYRDMTTNPPLYFLEDDLLMRTLWESHSPLAFKPHPTQLIRSLCVPGYLSRELSQYLDALRNLIEISPSTAVSGQLVRGAALRALKWDSAVGADELAGLLCTPGYFPNLKELAVTCGESGFARFDFIQVPDLEKLECILSFSGPEYQEWKPSWSSLRRALAVLPLSSPLLHTFILRLDLHTYGDSDNEESYHTIPETSSDVDADLIAAINQLRFSALTSFEFSVRTSGFRLREPAMDFSPVLCGNPLLTNVTLNVEGICVPPDADAVFLSRLVSFTGSVKNCAAVSAYARGLRDLTVLFPVNIWPDYIQNMHESTRLFTPDFFPPHANPAVRSLNVWVVDLTTGSTRDDRTLRPDSFTCLVTAFPNLTHLNVGLCYPISEYRAGFAALLRLQHLCIRVHEYVAMTDYSETAAKLFPADKYTSEINDSLLSLSQLSDVHIVVTGCKSCYEREVAPPNLLVEYWFGRALGEEFSLVEMTTSDGSE